MEGECSFVSGCDPIPDPIDPPDPEPDPIDLLDGENDNRKHDLEAIMDMCVDNPNVSPDCLQIPPPADCSMSGYHISDTGYSPPGCHFDHFETTIDWAGIDWWNIGVNLFSMSGHAALVVGFFGGFGIGLVPASEYYAFTQVVGIAYDVITFDKGAITWDAVSTVINFDDHFPLSGGLVNFYHIGEEIGDSILNIPIYEPDITYPYPPIPMP